MSASVMRISALSRATTSAANLLPPRGAPSRRARARRGSVGTRPSSRPTGVALPSSSIAPRPRSTATASRRLSAGSGSSRRSPAPPGVPQHASSRAASVRSVVAISGEGRAGAAANVRSSTQRMTVPGPCRVARPARWTAEERDVGTVTRPLIPRAASRCGCRERQVSTTRRTPGTVSEDSASDVVTMIRGISCAPRPRMTASWSAAGSWPCSSRTSTSSARARMPRAISATSRAPGANTRTSAVGSVRDSSRPADAAVPATWSRKAWVTPRSSSRGAGLGAQRSSSGCCGIVCVTTGAGAASVPITAATRSASSVADIATRTRSSRSWRTSPRSPISRSVSSARSCTSSMMIASTPSRAGSSRRRRRSTPAVTNSMRVCGPPWRSPRTVKPTRPPSEVSSSWASRRAAARAATRLGCVTITFPTVRFATTGGTSVVFPVPGGALTTTAGL